METGWQKHDKNVGLGRESLRGPVSLEHPGLPPDVKGKLKCSLGGCLENQRICHGGDLGSMR